jgi:hypothetical protein
MAAFTESTVGPSTKVSKDLFMVLQGIQCPWLLYFVNKIEVGTQERIKSVCW